VQTAFDKIVDGKGNFPNHQFCFFIDGLDEFEGPNASSWWDLAQSLKLWADKNDRVKICVATREWNEFDHTFQIQQRLRLQDLTRNDLVQVVHSRLAIEKQRRADYFLNLEKQDVAILTNLEQEVVSKAEGVFLWVRLVLEQLYTAFNYRYDHHQLHQKMQEIPTKLKEFFEYILKTIPKDDQQDAYTMLYFAMSTLKNSMRLDPLQSGNRKELPLLQYAFLNNYTKNRRFTEDLETQGRDTKNLEHFLEGARALVTGKCRGLLEVQSAAQRSRNRQVQRSSEVNREFATISNDQHAQQCSAINQDHAIFAHRSILEFLEEHLHDRSFDFVDAYIQTSVAIVKYVPFPDDRTAFLDIHTWTLHAVMTTMFQHEKGMDSLIHYHSLEDLNTALNDRQRVPDWSVATPVESKPSRLTGTDLRKERLVSVHHLAAWCGFHKYLAWMLATTPNVPQAADGAELVQMALLRMQVEAYLPLRNTKAPESSQTLRVLFKGRIDTNSFSNRPQDKGLTIWEAFVLGNTFRHAATQEFFEIVIFFLENGAYVPGWAPTVPGQIGEQQRKVTISFGKREIILKRWNKHQISRGRKLSSYDPFQFSESLTEYGKQITLRDFLARAIDHAARCHGKEKEKKDLELLAKRLDHVLRQSEKGKPGVLQAIGLPEAETIAYIAVAVIIAMIAILPTQRGTTQLYHILLRSLSSYHNQMADFLQRAALPWAILGWFDLSSKTTLVHSSGNFQQTSC
jgi:hypothetical protein